jgi:hypothetical protein
LRTWVKGIDGKPGFSKEAFEVLEQRVQNTPYPVYAGITFDEMSIKKKIDYRSSEFVGYVDFGGVITRDSCEGVEAKQVFVLMLVGLNVSWKVPIAYFLINSLTASEKSSILMTSIRHLQSIGINVHFLSFDGLRSNIAAAELLGACMKIDNLRPYFPNPVTGENVYVVLDACHMMKVARNVFRREGGFKDMYGRLVDWQFIARLHDLQVEEGLKVGNKLTKNHLNFFQQKMKVKLAVQVLSESVADALDFLGNDLKLRQFEGYEATAFFCRLTDRFFDICNTKNPLAKGFNAPLNAQNQKEWEPFLEEVEQYFRELSA